MDAINRAFFILKGRFKMCFCHYAKSGCIKPGIAPLFAKYFVYKAFKLVVNEYFCIVSFHIA